MAARSVGDIVESGEGRVLGADLRLGLGCSHADVIDVSRMRPAVAARTRRGVGAVVSQVITSDDMVSKNLRLIGRGSMLGSSIVSNKNQCCPRVSGSSGHVSRLRSFRDHSKWTQIQQLVAFPSLEPNNSTVLFLSPCCSPRDHQGRIYQLRSCER